jgi:predicted acyl esterase
VLIAQDVRGRNDSEGSWQPFVNEREDGYDLLGRAGWINKFRLVLIERDLELYLSHHDE